MFEVGLCQCYMIVWLHTNYVKLCPRTNSLDLKKHWNWIWIGYTHELQESSNPSREIGMTCNWKKIESSTNWGVYIYYRRRATSWCIWGSFRSSYQLHRKKPKSHTAHSEYTHHQSTESCHLKTTTKRKTLNPFLISCLESLIKWLTWRTKWGNLSA